MLKKQCDSKSEWFVFIAMALLILLCSYLENIQDSNRQYKIHSYQIVASIYSNNVDKILENRVYEIKQVEEIFPKNKKATNIYNNVIRIYPSLEDNEDLLLIIDTSIDMAIKHDINSDLIMAVIFTESAFDQYARNRCCDGLMQINRNFHVVEDPFDIEQNIDYGAKLLRNYIDRYGYRRGLDKYSGGATGYVILIYNHICQCNF